MSERRSSVNAGLYALLGVEKTATAREIKKGFHKMSLKYHPDKNPEEGPVMFPAIQRAHEVLTDPQKKAIYDRAGEAGLKQMEMMGGGVPPWLMSAGKSILSCMLCMLSLMFLLFVIFLAMRADKTVDWSWDVVFIPLWILDSLLLFGTCCILQPFCQKSDDPDEQPERPSILTPIKPLCFVAFHIMLVLKLDGNATYTWAIAFAPLFVLLALNLLSSALAGLATLQVMGMAASDARRDKIVHFFRKSYAFLNAVAWSLKMLVFAVLIMLKLDEHTDWAWVIVFLPIYLPLAIFWIIDTVLAVWWPPADRPEDAPSPLGEQGFTLLGHSIVYITVALLVTRLEGGASAGVSAAIAILPLLLILGCMVCCGCLIFIMPMPDDFPEEDEEDVDIAAGNAAQITVADKGEPAPAEASKSASKSASPEETPLNDSDATAAVAEVAVDVADDGDVDDMD